MSSPQTPDLLREMDACWRAASEQPHGLTDKEFDTLFTKDWPIIFAFHGYPWLIHRLTYRRTNHKNLHVRGHEEEGTKTPCATGAGAASARRCARQTRRWIFEDARS